MTISKTNCFRTQGGGVIELTIPVVTDNRHKSEANDANHLCHKPADDQNTTDDRLKSAPYEDCC